MKYISSKNNKQELGMIGISTTVFESIAALSIDEIDAIRLMGDFPFGNDLCCKVEDNNIILDLDVKVKTGKNVSEVCRQAQEAILSSISLMTDYHNVIVNLSVKGFFI